MTKIKNINFDKFKELKLLSIYLKGYFKPTFKQKKIFLLISRENRVNNQIHVTDSIIGVIIYLHIHKLNQCIVNQCERI